MHSELLRMVYVVHGRVMSSVSLCFLFLKRSMCWAVREALDNSSAKVCVLALDTVWHESSALYVDMENQLCKIVLRIPEYCHTHARCCLF